MERILLRPAEAAEVIAVSRARVYQLLKTGDLPSIRVGGRLRVPIDELRAWVRGQASRNSEA